MKMYSRSPRRKKRRGLVWLLAVLLVAGAVLHIFWPAGEKNTNNTETQLQADYSEEAGIDAGNIEKTGGNGITIAAEKTGKTSVKKPPAKVVSRTGGGKVVFGPAGMTASLAGQIGPSPITVAKISKAQAEKAMEEGLKLFAANKDLLNARAMLNRAYNSGTLSQPRAVIARKALESLADRTVLAADSYVNPKDPYLLSYTFQGGDMLNSQRKGGTIVRKGVIARCDLNVPADILLKVNRLRSAAGFRAGRSYKLLKGPFHLVIHKGKRVADIYLQDLFVRRIPVCVGAPETPTPEGYFRIAAHGKTLHSAYNSPVETGQPNYTLLPHNDGYPLDKLGHNMKIEGIAQLGTKVSASQSYAIHGTCAPASIGTASSRGCIRAGDRDVQLLFGILQSYADPKNPNVTWKRWSTITIKKGSQPE